MSLQDKYENARYDSTYDSYYDPKTGKWIEDKCGAQGCEFCSKRPAWATPTTDENIEARVEAWHDEDFGSLPEQPLIEYLGLTWNQYATWVETNKLPK